MNITAISAQIKDKNRVNVFVDGKYRFSLDVYQVADLGIRLGKDYTEEELDYLETESQFGKVYSRALEYVLMRPHSAKEVRDYLYRKTRDTKTKTGDIKKGVSSELVGRVFDRLVEKGYVDDEKFTRYWLENRSMARGASRRRLISELRSKGVEQVTIEKYLIQSERVDEDEIKKIITKKQNRYPDKQKFMQYLARQGFNFDDIRTALDEVNDERGY